MACIVLIICNSDDVEKPPKINVWKEDCAKVQQCGKTVPTQPNVIKPDQYCELNAADGISVLPNVSKQDPPMGMTSTFAMDSQCQMDNTSQGQQPKGFIQTIIQYFRGKEAHTVPELKLTPKKILNCNGKTHTLVTGNPTVFQNLIILLGTEVSCI